MLRLIGRPARLALGLAFSIVLLLAPAAAQADTPAQPAPAEQLPINVGGSRLLVLDSDSDKGSIFAVMLAGIGNQRPDETHVAHVSEHVVFKNPGPDGRNLVQYATGVGGIYNGWTGPNHTQFELTVPSAEIPAAVERLVASLFAQDVDAAALNAEITERLTPELKFMTSNQLSAPANAGQMAMFSGTRYYEARFAVPVSTVSPEQVAAFKSREYSPARLLVVVCAKVKASDVQAALAHALADTPPGAPPAPTSVSLSPVSSSLTVAGSISPRMVAGLVFNDVSAEETAVAHVVSVLLAQRALESGIPGLKPIPQLLAPMPLDGAAGVFLGFTRSGLGALSLGHDKVEASAVSALKAAWQSLRDQGPTDDEISSVLSGWGQQGTSPDSVPVSLITAFNAGIRCVPGSGTLLRQNDAPITKEQLSTDVRAFLASHEPTEPYTVFLQSQTYLRTMALRVGIGLAIAAAIGAAVATRIANRRRRGLAQSPPDVP